MSGLLRHGIMRRSHKGQHRRIRSLERRADEGDADRARIREELRDIKACLLVMGGSLDGDIPAELTCAVASGSPGPVTLDVGGQPVVAGLDPGEPCDVVEIWRAIKTAARQAAS
jgi:hypothetical protein